MKQCPDTKECGFTTEDPNERFCLDCGKPLVDAPTGNSPAPADVTDVDLPPPAPPDEDLDTRPVAYTLVLPVANQPDGTKDPLNIPLREGDRYTVASERSTADVSLKLPDAKNPGVSSKDLVFFVEGGELKVTGGGPNGFKVTTVEPHAETDVAVVRKAQTVVAGARTPFRVK